MRSKCRYAGVNRIDQAFNPSDVKGSDAFLGREFPMSSRDFRKISALSYKLSGIVLSDAKQEMVYSRLARRLRVLGIQRFEQYMEVIESGDKAEQEHFLNSITTNLTSFFRENHHFEYLKDIAIPALRKVHAADRRIRVWCSAASTGEEPYSIAMVFRESFPASSGWDIKILATDIDSEVVNTAKQGVYAQNRVDGMPEKRLKRWFTKTPSGHYEVEQELKNMLTFKTLNLLHSWPMHGPFDVVFCRNVIIYFDKQTQCELFEKIQQMMPADRFLFIGHSESLLHVSDAFDSKGGTIYHKR